MSEAYFMGLDIAKNIFQVFAADEQGRKIFNKKIRREAMHAFFENLPPCIIGMEACGTAHYWARTLTEMGHCVRLIQPIRVKAFLGHKNKTDAADAQAICEALMHPGTQFVAMKTVRQQDIDHMHRLRERLVEERTRVVNQTRSFLAERGIVIPQGIHKFEQFIREMSAIYWEGFSDDFEAVITENFSEFCDLNEKIKVLDARIKAHAENSEICKNLMTIKGVGPLTASALEAQVGDATQFKNGRQMAAYLGLTPKEYSSGGKQCLLGITKRGSRHLRVLLILAARSVFTGLQRRKRDDNGNIPHLTGMETWALALEERIGIFKATVALANKLARIAWAVMSRKEAFNPQKYDMASVKA